MRTLIIVVAAGCVCFGCKYFWQLSTQLPPLPSMNAPCLVEQINDAFPLALSAERENFCQAAIAYKLNDLLLLCSPVFITLFSLIY